MEICNIYKLIKQIPTEWSGFIDEESEKPYFRALAASLVELTEQGTEVLPASADIFRAFHTCVPSTVRVVILGQDPYHRQGQAMGLSFSVPRGVRVPPSLRNVYKELHRDLDVPTASHGDLTSWATQGVFLLNSMLTVSEGEAGSHRKLGWQIFTDAVIRYLSEQKSGLVFMLWGNFAKGKAVLIDQDKHLVLQAAHPSPLAGNRYAGSAHFSKANSYLVAQGKGPINWAVEESLFT